MKTRRGAFRAPYHLQGAAHISIPPQKDSGMRYHLPHFKDGDISLVDVLGLAQDYTEQWMWGQPLRTYLVTCPIQGQGRLSKVSSGQ